MIVERSARLRSYYEQRADLKQKSDRLTQIRETRSVVESLEPLTREVTTTLWLVRDRLDDEELQQLDRQVGLMADLVKKSEQKFGADRRQVVSLGHIEKAAKALQGHIDLAWQGYAHRKLQGFRDLLVVVRPLPDLIDQAAKLHDAISGMEAVSRSAPRTATRLRSFDEALERVGVQAGAFDGLPDSVRLFLGLVVRGHATLADVTPETWVWLNDHGYLGAFRVQFGREESR